MRNIRSRASENSWICGTLQLSPDRVYDYTMAGCAFVVAKEVFHYRNSNILTLWEWLNSENQFFLFKYIIKHLYLEKHFNHLKLRYTDLRNFLTKRALVSQPIKLIVAKDSNILHYLNLSINSPSIILLIIWYTPNIIVPHKWTQIWWLALPN